MLTKRHIKKGLVYNIAVLVVLLGLAVAGCAKPTATLIPTSLATSQIEYVGRVLSQDTNAPIHDAKVTLDFQGAPPVVYTDSEGIYRFTIDIEGDKLAGRVRVEANSHDKYDRNITLFSTTSTIEDIRLAPSVPTPTNTYTPFPTKSATPPSLTATSTPSPESVHPTLTPTPQSPTSTPTVEPKPSESDMKSVGEGYSANGVSLMLRSYDIGASVIDLEFIVKNESNGSMTMRYQNSYFELYDDTGRKYERHASCEYDTKQQQFEPGDTVKLHPQSGCYFNEIGDFQGVIGENTKYLIVRVSKFMDLQDMQWRIDLMPSTSSEQYPSSGEELSLGEGFSANGLTLILTDYSIGSSVIDLDFIVKNESNGRMLIRYQNSYFEVYDDLGNRYERKAGCLQDTKQQQFEPGDTVKLYPQSGCYFNEVGDFQGVIGENVQYLIVQISKFMDLQDMQWRIDLMPSISSEQYPSSGEELSLGEGFSANGLTLILTDYSIGSSVIDLDFIVKNESNGRMLIRYQNSYFEVYDDLGNRYERKAGCLQDTKQQQFEPGDTVKLYPQSGCYFNEVGDFRGVIGENAKYLIVRVSKFMDLRDMQWRIEL